MKSLVLKDKIADYIVIISLVAFTAILFLMLGHIITLNYSFFEDFVFSHETLTSGMLAFFGAVITVLMINRQIRQSDRVENTRVAREQLAARAALPMKLSLITKYARDCLSAMTYEPAARTSALQDLLEDGVEEAVSGQIQGCIRYADSKHGEALAELLHWLQVHNARLDGFVREASVREHTLHQAIIDAAMLHALAGNLFAYGRLDDDGMEEAIDAYHLRAALPLDLRYLPQWEALRQEVVRRFPPVSAS